MKPSKKPPGTNILHKNDIFGYQIPLNFNGRRSTHTTSIGGMFSIMIKGVYIYYIIRLVIQMVTYQNDSLNS